jgi:ABC-type uncharacterized transport system involved in gliding motility auxiliary subunit
MDAAKKKILLQQLTSLALFVAVLAVAGWLSTRYKLELDWTAGGRNTLTEASQKQLAAMPDPIAFKVFIYPRSEIRQSIEADVRRYQRVKSDVVLEFIDPSTHPHLVQEYNVSRPGEVVLEYQGRRENLTATTEQAITTALQRLAYAGERWVVFLEGHGERSISDDSQNGYTAFAQMLRDKGLSVRGLNLATSPSVPDNTSALVIANPARPLLEGEVKLVREFVERGGNLLWLSDPGSPPGLEPLEEALGVTWLKGVGILLESAALGLPPFIYITTFYPPNPVTTDFHENALFPLVRGLSYRRDAGWNAQPLLTTTENAWLETGSLERDLEFDPAAGDTAGPLTIGLTLTRSIRPDEPGVDGAPAGEVMQRVALIGDSDFLSNGYVGQLGNSVLGMNLVQWLSTSDALLNIDVPRAPDRSLLIPPWGLYTIYIGFAFLLPALLLGFGITRWAVRRRR